jgi:hypothetical protein
VWQNFALSTVTAADLKLKWERRRQQRTSSMRSSKELQAYGDGEDDSKCVTKFASPKTKSPYRQNVCAEFYRRREPFKRNPTMNATRSHRSIGAYILRTKAFYASGVVHGLTKPTIFNNANRFPPRTSAASLHQSVPLQGSIYRCEDRRTLLYWKITCLTI